MVPLTAIGACALVACRAPAPSTDEREVVVAPLDSLFGLSRSITLDEPDDYPIGMILDAALDPGGTIYLSDFSAREVRAYDQDGAHPRVIGGTGQGPGEYLLPTSIAWDSPNRQLAVADLGNARIVRFSGSADGSSVESRIEVELGLKYLRFGPAGQTVGAGLSRSPDFDISRTLAFVSTGADTAHFLPVPEPMLGSPYTRSVITGIVDSSERQIIAAVTGHPVIYRFDYRGTVLDSVVLPGNVYASIPLPDQILDSRAFQQQHEWMQGLRSAADGKVAVVEIFEYDPDLDDWLQKIAWIPIETEEPIAITEPCDCRLVGVEGDQVLLLRGTPPFERTIEWRILR